MIRDLKYKDITEKIIGASFEVHKFLATAIKRDSLKNFHVNLLADDALNSRAAENPYLKGVPPYGGSQIFR